MRARDFLTQNLASGLRLGHGAQRRKLKRTQDPEELLILYAFEACPFCRYVRETLTELDLDYIHKSAPKGASPKREELRARAGKVQFPYLIDPNTGTEMFESDAIVAYLEATYG